MKLAMVGGAGARITLWMDGRGPVLASVVLALALAALAARTVLGFLGAHATGEGQVANLNLPAFTGAAPAAGVDAAQLAAAHLFGSATASLTETGGAPQTGLALVLAGTIAYRDPALGFAILGETAETAKFFRVGAQVPGGAQLHSVYADRVVLERNGALETLTLPRDLPAGMAPPALPTAAPVAEVQGFPPRPRRPSIDVQRRAMADNPAFVAEIIRPTPVLMDGQLQGFRVYPGRDRAAFTTLGLQPGDLVTQVNGTALTDPARGLSAITGLQPGDRVSVTVSRNGVTRDITIDANQLSDIAGKAAPSPESTE